ncbi:MAG: carbamoyltransferase family protein, partial [Pseudomonadales bacterium]
VDYCLGVGGIGVKDLDHVVFYERPMVKFERMLETFMAFAPGGFNSFRRAMPTWANSKLQLPATIVEALGDEFRGELAFTNHHESHAASAFYPSPFEEAAILTLDAVGEWGTSSIAAGNGNRITTLHEMRFPHSLGMLYSAFTAYTGFKVNSGEYKLMGLAPYGEPRYSQKILDNLVEIKDDGSLWMDMSYFNYCQGSTMTSEKFHDLFGGPPRRPESAIEQKHMDLAASIQVVCERVVLSAARYARQCTSFDNLVMAGGVALNCVANGRILRECDFKNLWIQPAAGDAGGALGAALLVWHQHLDKPRTPHESDAQRGSLLGPEFSNDEIRLLLDSMGASYEYIEDSDVLDDRVARLMDEENVIGWFQGKMEFGPRALGSRSIIGDARSTKMQQTMNLKIKYRESFRPFAPCVLKEHVHEIFEMRPDEDSPYMLLVAPVQSDQRLELSEEDRALMNDSDLHVRVSVARSTLPAITHVDYSARIQTVDTVRHRRLHRLMSRFNDLTSCPVIVNTSFNIRGEPIVCTPEEAYRCFVSTDMDCLVLENCILLKSEQAMGLLQDAEQYKASYKLD